MFCDFRPQPDQPILEILVDPESCYMRTVVGVPATILTSGCGVHIQNSVNTVFGARGNGAVEMLEAFRLEDTWIHVILEVAVADCDADAVESN